MISRRALTSLAVGAVLVSSLVGCTDKSAKEPAAAPSSAPKLVVPQNPYAPQDILSKGDLLALASGDKLLGYKCARHIANDPKIFPTNALACSAKTEDGVRVRVATTVDNRQTNDESFDNSGLLADTGGTTGRHAVSSSAIAQARPYGTTLYVACNPYDHEEPVACPETSDDAKKADRILVNIDIPGSPSGAHVSLLLGTPGSDIPVERLLDAANAAVDNLNQEFKKDNEKIYKK